jgi:hypothetical protein
VRAVGELVILVAIVAFLVVFVRAAIGTRRGAGASEAKRLWRVDTRTREDGTLVVALRRDPGDERVVRELPPGMDATDLAAELQLAREDAELALRELNRP